MMPNALHFCCGDGPRPQCTDGSRPRASAGRPRQQQVRVRRNPGAGGPDRLRAARWQMLGEGGPATLRELHVPHPDRRGLEGPKPGGTGWPNRAETGTR